MKIKKLSDLEFNLILGILATTKPVQLKHFIKGCFSLTNEEKKEIIDYLDKEGNYCLYKKVKKQKEEII